MERRRQRELALAAVAVLAIALAAYRVRTMSPASAQTSPPVRQSATVPGSAAQPQPKGLNEVDLSALNAPKAAPQTISRDPFRFRMKAPPPPPPGPIRPAGPQQTGPVEPPPPPHIPLKFIGTLESQKPGRVAILSDGRGVYYGHVGEIIEGRYRIVQIGVESIELAYLDGRGRQTIRLTGQ
jgi:hypothetical protein